MPIYEYQCLKCGERSEVMQRVSDAPLTTCPECGGELKKLISAPAFQFKGSGWYVTDYARKAAAGGEAASSDTAAEKGTEAAASTPASEGSKGSGKAAQSAKADKPSTPSKSSSGDRAS